MSRSGIVFLKESSLVFFEGKHIGKKYIESSELGSGFDAENPFGRIA